MPLPHARKVAFLLGSTLSVLLVFASFHYASLPSHLPWQSILLYSIGLVIPVVGGVLSQDIVDPDASFFDRGALRYSSGTIIAFLGGILLFILISCVQWRLPAREQLETGFAWAFIIGMLGVIVLHPLNNWRVSAARSVYYYASGRSG